MRKSEKTFRLNMKNLFQDKLKIAKNRLKYQQIESFGFVYKIVFNKFTENVKIFPKQGMIGDKALERKQLEDYFIKMVSADSVERRILHMEEYDTKEILRSCPRCSRVLKINSPAIGLSPPEENDQVLSSKYSNSEMLAKKSHSSNS